MKLYEGGEKIWYDNWNTLLLLPLKKVIRLSPKAKKKKKHYGLDRAKHKVSIFPIHSIELRSCLLVVLDVHGKPGSMC